MRHALKILLALALALSAAQAGAADPDRPQPPMPKQVGLNDLPPSPDLADGTPKTCPANQVMHGLNGLTPICMPASCPNGQVLRGIVNNLPVCVDPKTMISTACTGSKLMTGFDASGNALCVDPPAGAQGTQGPQGPAGIAGAGLKFFSGSGCGACPYGSSGGYCSFKNQNGDLLQATVGGFCGSGGNVGFWSY